jgi:hypothetical protein
MSPVVRKNPMRASRRNLLQPVLMVQAAKHCLASENMSWRKAMTVITHR